jgi:negative regulator of sigma E activity
MFFNIILEEIKMVSITLSVPDETRELMNRFSEINWSGFIRKSIEEKAKELSWKEEMLKQINEEKSSGFTDWTIELGKKANSAAFEKVVSKLTASEKKKIGL